MKARWIFQVLCIGLIWLVLSRLAEIENVGRTLAEGRWEWLLVAAILQFAYYITYAAIFQSAFRIAGLQAGLGELIPLTFAALFLNVVAPAGGSTGAALLIDDSKRKGRSAAGAAVGVLLAHIADFTGFLPILGLGMVFLFHQHELKPLQIVGACVLVTLVAAMCGLVLLGMRVQPAFLRFLGWFQGLINASAKRLRMRPPMSETWAASTAAEFGEAALAVASKPGRLGSAIAVAVGGYIIDLASLYCVFRAFNQQASIGMLVASLSIAVLFWIVAITPQGIGVVEGSMALVLVSLGVGAEKSAVIAVAFRGVAFWLPLLVGFLLARRLPAFHAQATEGSDKWEIRLLALLTAAMGIINILSAVTPSLASRLKILEAYSPFGVHAGGHLTAAMAGFALLLLADGIRRRKQTAWIMTIVVLWVSIFAHLVKGLDYEEAILAGLLLAWLAPLRSHFHARTDPPSIRQGLTAVFAALAFTLAYGVSGFFLLDRHFSVNFGLGRAARQTVVMFTEFYDPGLQPITGFGRYFASSIYAVGAMTEGYALLLLIRPVLVHLPASAEQRDRARMIVEAHGHSSLAALTLLPDKLYAFSPGGSVIAYVVEGRVALALGDPIGPEHDAPEAIAGFQDLCRKNDWQPSFYQVLPQHLALYKAAGFSSVCIGNEAIVNLEKFTLAGGENKGLRSAYNKLVRLGYRSEVSQPPHEALLLHALGEVSDQWLTLVHGTEKRFSLGWFDTAYLNQYPLLVVRNPQGGVEAFANILPEFQAPEVTVDMMRHQPEAEHGEMDFLFASLLQWAGGQGFSTFNLGLSALSGVGENPQDGALQRTLHYVYEHVNQFYDFKGLHAFKEKFHPSWQPRYLVYPGAASLPGVAVSLIRADQGSGLIAGYW